MIRPCAPKASQGPCSGGSISGISCVWCGDTYFRCENHGGAKGAKRSLTSHKGICPRRTASPSSKRG